MSSLTPHFGFYLPAEGDGLANGQTWAQQVNANFVEIDGRLTRRATWTISASAPTGTITVPASWVILSETSTQPGRLRLYRTEAERTADADRLAIYDPTPDAGVVLDDVFTATALTIRGPEVPAGCDGTLYWAWDGPATVITLTVLILEA